MKLFIYNQFITYIKNINYIFDFNCHIDMSNSEYIYVSNDEQDKNKIIIKNNYNIESIIKIYNSEYVKLNDYYKTINKQINLQSINATYHNDNIVKSIVVYCESEIFVVTNYLDFNDKIIKDREQRSFIVNNQYDNQFNLDYMIEILKIKYGNELIYTISYNIRIINEINYLTIDLLISNINLEYVDLLDIIPYYEGHMIINGFIKKGNYCDLNKMKNKLHNIYKTIENNNCECIFNISITNSKYLKIINNIIYFQNACYIKIDNCPLLEFIQNYNNFSKIYIDNQLIQSITE